MQKRKEEYVKQFEKAWGNISSEFSEIPEDERIKIFMENATAEEVAGYYLVKYTSHAHFIWITDVRNKKDLTKRDFEVTALIHTMVMAG